MSDKNVAKSDPRSARNGIASSTTSISMAQVRADTATTSAISFSDEVVRDIFDKIGNLPPIVSMSFFRGESVNSNFSFIPYNRLTNIEHFVGGSYGTPTLAQYNGKMYQCVARKSNPYVINYVVEVFRGTWGRYYKMAFRDVNGTLHVSTNSNKLSHGRGVDFTFSVNSFSLLMAFSVSNSRVSFEIYAVS